MDKNEAAVTQERDDNPPTISAQHETNGQRPFEDMRGKATTTMSTDQLMELLRGE
jgi:hypothetical protein